MTASWPKTYSPFREPCAFDAWDGVASMAVMATAATMATRATGLRIHPPRRAPEQQDEQSVDGEEEEDGEDAPADGRMRRGVAREADEVAQHVEHPGRRRHGVRDRQPGRGADDEGEHENTAGEREDQPPRPVRGAFPRSDREGV